jgi:hypothetical protein
MRGLLQGTTLAERAPMFSAIYLLCHKRRHLRLDDGR